MKRVSIAALVLALGVGGVFMTSGCDQSKDQLQQVQKQLTDVTAERDNLKSQLDQMKTQVTTLQTQLDDMKKQAAATPTPAPTPSPEAVKEKPHHHGMSATKKAEQKKMNTGRSHMHAQ